MQFPSQSGNCYRGHTNSSHQSPSAQKQYVDSFLFILDLLTHSIHSLNQAHVGFDEGVLGLGIQLLDINCNAIGSLLGAADVVDARLAGETSEFFESVFADAIGPTYEDGDQARRESGWDASIRGLDYCKGDHLTSFQAVFGGTVTGNRFMS
jgi:hypothetical protein